jgi:hypothetical protein
MNNRGEVPKGLTYQDIGNQDIRVLEVERSRLHKSRNSERITAVDLRKDACCAIVQFGDPGTGIRGGKSPETGIGISRLQRSTYRESRRQEIEKFLGGKVPGMI